MAACKRRRENKCMPEALASPGATTECTLPADLQLEVIARSDTRTLVRCAGSSKLLRRDILDRSFIHRVTQQEGGIVPRCIVAYLNTHHDMADPPPPLISLAHSATASAAAVSFLDDHMSPYMSRYADDLLGEHIPVTSRGGLVLLRRRRPISHGLSNLCVYDLFTGHRTFLSNPPDIGSNCNTRYVLLTAADGIGCSFMLFFTSFPGMRGKNNTRMVQARTATSASSPTWAPSATVLESSGCFDDMWRAMDCRGGGAVVLYGGVIHWLLPQKGEIVTYNVCTMEQGKIMLPALVTNLKGGWPCLGSYYSHDGRKLLRLMVYKELKMHVWHQLADGDWAPTAMTIDMEKTLPSLDPDIKTGNHVPVFEWSGEGSNMVLLRIDWFDFSGSRSSLLILLHLETKEILVQQDLISKPSVLLEVDLPSRLRAMNLYP